MVNSSSFVCVNSNTNHRGLLLQDLTHLITKELNIAGDEISSALALLSFIISLWHQYTVEKPWRQRVSCCLKIGEGSPVLLRSLRWYGAGT